MTKKGFKPSRSHTALLLSILLHPLGNTAERRIGDQADRGSERIPNNGSVLEAA